MSNAIKNTPSKEAMDAHQLQKLMRANDNFQEAKNEHQSVVKSVEAKGVHLKAAARAIKIKNSGKSEDAVEELKCLFLYLRILGYPITTEQLDMFSAIDERTPDIEKAYERGLMAGRLGQGDGENPYSIASAQGQKFLEGMAVGTEERRLILSLEATSDGDEILEGSRGEIGDGDDDDGDSEDDGVSDLVDESTTEDDPFSAPGPDVIDPGNTTAH